MESVDHNMDERGSFAGLGFFVCPRCREAGSLEEIRLYVEMNENVSKAIVQIQRLKIEWVVGDSVDI